MLLAAEKGYKQDNEYLQNLAIAYTNAGKPAEAINLLKGILEKRPSDVNIINMLAEAYYDSKKYDEAISYYDKLLQMNARNAEAIYMMGMCFQKKGEKQKGMALCDKAIQIDPSLQSLKQEKKLPWVLERPSPSRPLQRREGHQRTDPNNSPFIIENEKPLMLKNIESF